ncbi:hypothetical protein D0T50_10475 [Bacteroides sp. 214]|uniref:hypothetical protein n=1 Tax=Bacteroides sp. 214 TaxID=2302935 RepID=UPI0013D4AAB0|nr:hypothetical protein [Bacteroides sp. 214]NDW13315.1 hypothetical protein [Bacteroides sp. 214]
MKKIALLTAGIAAIMMTACQKDDNLPQEQQEKFTITATMPQKADTRVGFEEVTGDPLSSLKVTWAAGDIIVDANNDSHSLAGGAGTTSGTFNFKNQPTDGATFTCGIWSSNQYQSSSDALEHLGDTHVMTGAYNAETQSIAFEHKAAVMRIALSGLHKSAELTMLQITRTDYESIALYLSDNSTTVDGTFVAWVSVDSEWLDAETNLTFRVIYADYDLQPYLQAYPHTFSSPIAAADIKGKLLHCNINMNPDAAAAKQEFLDWYNAGMTTDFALSGDIDLSGVTDFYLRSLGEGKTFDGGGYTITGLNINNSASVGLFRLNLGTIKNVTIKGATIGGQNASAVGDNFGSIINCRAINCTIDGSAVGGAITGVNMGTIVGCYESGNTITSAYAAGGIAGNNAEDGIILACHGNGSTISGDYCAGGIAGNNVETITACYATPTSVSSSSDIAGAVVGMNDDGSANTCYWQHSSLTEGVGANTSAATDTTAKDDLANCYNNMNTVLAGTAADDAGVSWDATGLVFAE